MGSYKLDFKSGNFRPMINKSTLFKGVNIRGANLTPIKGRVVLIRGLG